MGRGPDALLSAGLAAALERSGHTVTTTTVDLPPAAFVPEIASAFALQRELSRHVAAARATGALPLVLAGNCNTAVGTVGGLLSAGAPTPAVCWFDAHADFNTPESTTSGFLDGMAVAMLTGHCWRNMTATVPGFRAVPESDVLMIGARDIDPLESDLLGSTAIGRVSAGAIGTTLPARLDALAKRASEVYLHLDLDVLDPSAGSANHYAVPSGLTAHVLADAVMQIGQRFSLAAMAITAYDPEADSDGRVAAIARNVVAQLFARR